MTKRSFLHFEAKALKKARKDHYKSLVATQKSLAARTSASVDAMQKADELMEEGKSIPASQEESFFKDSMIHSRNSIQIKQEIESRKQEKIIKSILGF